MKDRHHPLAQRGGWIVPLGMLVAAAVALAQVPGFPEVRGNIPGPAVMPVLLAVALALCAVALLVKGTKSSVAAAPPEPWRKLALLLAVMCAYALLMPVTGFISGTALLLFASLKIFGHRGGVRGWAFALGLAFVLWAVFGKLMRVALPEGLIG